MCAAFRPVSHDQMVIIDDRSVMCCVGIVIFMPAAVILHPYMLGLRAAAYSCAPYRYVLHREGYPFALYNERTPQRTLRIEPLFRWLFGHYLEIDTWQRKTWSALVVVTLIVLLVFGFRWVERIEDESRPAARSTSLR